MRELQSRIQWEQKESQILAPYATLSSESAGRVHSEPVHVFRSEFQRDRDRIVHSSAFRRLESKTQVVIKFNRDPFRSRLTHTIEVASLARTISRTLCLNEDLSESIALAHDLGHPPFGHSGEATLNELMKGQGGFEHNRQSLRIVEELEVKYPEFNGINLSYEVREGIAEAHFPHKGKRKHPSLEAQITDLTDEIAYCCHDVDDALHNGLIDERAMAEVSLWKELHQELNPQYSKIDPQRRQRFLIRKMVDYWVDDVCHQSASSLAETNVQTSLEARQTEHRLIAFSPAGRKKLSELKQFLHENFYQHPFVSETNQKACLLLKKTFEFFSANPQLLKDQAVHRIKKDGTMRAVCDYVAGMTDRYALQVYAEHFGRDELWQDLAHNPSSEKQLVKTKRK